MQSTAVSLPEDNRTANLSSSTLKNNRETPDEETPLVECGLDMHSQYTLEYNYDGYFLHLFLVLNKEDFEIEDKFEMVKISLCYAIHAIIKDNRDK